MKTSSKELTLLAENKKAHLDFEIIKTYTAGIVLKGTEVKAAIEKKISLADSYCQINRNLEAYVYKMHIGLYSCGGKQQHDPLRIRKLLLKKNEIIKIYQFQQEKKGIIVPIRVFLTPYNKIKVEIACVKPLKKYDKRAKLKEKELKRRMKDIPKGKW